MPPPGSKAKHSSQSCQQGRPPFIISRALGSFGIIVRNLVCAAKIATAYRTDLTRRVGKAGTKFARLNRPSVSRFLSGGALSHGLPLLSIRRFAVLL